MEYLIFLPMIITLLCIGVLKLAHDEPKITKNLIRIAMWSSITSYIIMLIFNFPIKFKLIWLPITILLILVNLKKDDKETVEDGFNNENSTVED